MPSNRSFNDSKPSINSALFYVSQRSNFELCISDNSKDDPKNKYYSNETNSKFKYKASPGFSISENWLESIMLADSNLISVMADDDFLVPLPGNQTYESDKNVIGYRPNIVVWDKEIGANRVTNFSITGNRAIDRVKNYFNFALNNNNSLYSFFRKDLILDIGTLCYKFHPMAKVHYYDWSQVLSYVSSGNLLTDNSTLYVYDNANWSGNTENINNYTEQLFFKNGLDKRSLLFISLFQAIDSFILIFRKSSPIPRDELLEAALFVFSSYLNNFFNAYSLNKEKYFLKEKMAIEKIFKLTSTSQVFSQAIEIIFSFDESLAIRYIQFYESVVEKPYGIF